MDPNYQYRLPSKYLFKRRRKWREAAAISGAEPRSGGEHDAAAAVIEE
jgi:hypothetical protein